MASLPICELIHSARCYSFDSNTWSSSQNDVRRQDHWRAGVSDRGAAGVTEKWTSLEIRATVRFISRTLDHHVTA